VQSSENDFIMAGTSSSGGEDDFSLIKVDEEGNLMWSHTYDCRDLDNCSALVQTSDGGFALAGSTTSLDPVNYDGWLLLTDENGDSLWSRTYGGEGRDGFSTILNAADGGFIVGGTTEINDNGWGDAWLIKIDQTGDSLWSQTLGGTIYDGTAPHCSPMTPASRLPELGHLTSGW